MQLSSRLFNSYISKDIYFVPVISWVVLSSLQTISYPLIFVRFIPLPASFTNNIIFIAIIFLFLISRNFKRSDRSYFFLFFGLGWSVALLFINRLSEVAEKIYYPGFIFEHFHVNLHSIVSLHYYYFLFFIILFSEKKFDPILKKIEIVADRLIRKFIRPTALEIYKEIND